LVAPDTRSSNAGLLWDAVKVLLVFCGVGPLIGLVVFSVGVSLATIASSKPDGIWLGPFFLLYGIVFAHFFGLPWAALAAVAAIALSNFAGPRAWIGPASGVASFAVAAWSGQVHLLEGSDAVFGPAPDSFDATVFGLMALVHVLSGLACWLIVRPLIRA
jgi:hypothetical protein